MPLILIAVARQMVSSVVSQTVFAVIRANAWTVNAFAQTAKAVESLSNVDGQKKAVDFSAAFFVLGLDKRRLVRYTKRSQLLYIKTSSWCNGSHGGFKIPCS